MTDDQNTETANIADEAAAEAAQDLHAQIALLQEELATAKQDVLYAQAETQNVRRRGEKELADAHAYAATRFARDVLSVADNIGRALATLPPGGRDDDAWKGLITGLEATERELTSVFERNGISRITALGQPLDPNLHQAMMEIPTNDAAPGTVLQEIQPGYTIKDRLLRAAMVAVAKAAD